jgi:uncharacterized protein (TIGR00255 family)
MPLASMTGFARRDGRDGAHRWTWEVRSVNGKGLDVRLKLPPGCEFLEAGARERIVARLGRGNVQATLGMGESTGTARVRLNEAVLADVVAALERLRARLPDAAPPALDGILSLRGVLETVDETDDEAARATLARAILADLDGALDALVADRQREGAAIGAVLRSRLDAVEAAVRAAEASPARQPEAIRARLKEQIETLVQASPALDPDRLHQEAVMLATRADIREEIDRLTAHVAAARALLAESGPVGRRLDFLAQEFNREANTLCAKANDRELTTIGLELKALVDQFREQVQNLE